MVEEPGGDKPEETGVRGERRATGFAPGAAGWITGSDLCFSIRSVLLVEGAAAISWRRGGFESAGWMTGGAWR